MFGRDVKVCRGEAARLCVAFFLSLFLHRRRSRDEGGNARELPPFFSRRATRRGFQRGYKSYRGVNSSANVRPSTESPPVSVLVVVNSVYSEEFAARCRAG